MISFFLSVISTSFSYCTSHHWKRQYKFINDETHLLDLGLFRGKFVIFLSA